MAETCDYCDPTEKTSWIGMIMKAIHGGPYRDISTAQKAKGLSVLSAALECVTINEIDTVKMEVLTVFNSLKQALPEIIFVRALQGIRGAGNCFDSIFHPTAVS